MTRQIISLNDNLWKLGMVPSRPFGPVDDLREVKEWLPARVPGDVRLDLLHAGKIPDPYYGMNNEAGKWVDRHDWWYVHDLDGVRNSEQRMFIVFEGIDYQSAVFWNGAELGRHVGMFSRQAYELPPGQGLIAVRVWGSSRLPRLKSRPREQLLRIAANRLNFGPVAPDRLATLKCQMGYGWDFAPRLLTCGIWDDVWVLRTREVLIRDLWVQAVPDGRATLRMELESTAAADLRIRIRLERVGGGAVTQSVNFEIHATPGASEYMFQFQIDSPHPWNPWDRGEPELYDAGVTVFRDEEELDSAHARFGLRTIDLAPNPGAPYNEAPWTWKINGVLEFVRGANWVPADSMPGRLLPEDYRAYIQLVRDANINLLRVWGGGLREKHAFYDLCDENGILVWQDFPFSATPVDRFPSDGAFLSLVRCESAAIVRSLRNHPSVVLWCGGNEFNPQTNRHVVEILRANVARHDGTRPFKPASPSAGEEHDWRVWHHLANTRDYRRSTAACVGEFGLQSPPNIEQLKEFLPERDQFPPGSSWKYHSAELSKLRRYAHAIKPDASSLGEFLQASQTAQLRGLQVMIEHARRNKPRVSGCIFWQFEEPWPAICWSVIDHGRHPKLAYFKIKELYNPVLISFEYPLQKRGYGDRVKGTAWLTNDTILTLRGELSAWLDDELVLRQATEVPMNSSAAVVQLEACIGEGSNSLRFELSCEGEIVATNEYDLNYCDQGEISWVGARLASLRSLVARDM